MTADTTTKTELLPCPSCKSISVFTEGNNDRYVECQDCGMRGPRFPNQEYAVHYWNALPQPVDTGFAAGVAKCVEAGDRRIAEIAKSFKEHDGPNGRNMLGGASAELKDLVEELRAFSPAPPQDDNALVGALKQIRDLDWQELNLGNYNDDDVAQLNQTAIDMFMIARDALAYHGKQP